MFTKNKALWLCIACFVITVLTAMSILTAVVRDRESRRRQSMETVFLMRQTDVALWRLDTYLSGVVTLENARATAEYYQPPGEDADKIIQSHFVVPQDRDWQFYSSVKTTADANWTQTFPVRETKRRLAALIKSPPPVSTVESVNSDNNISLNQNAVEFQQRRQIVAQNVQMLNSFSSNRLPEPVRQAAPPFCPLIPVWHEGRLVLARAIQGSPARRGNSETDVKSGKADPPSILVGSLLDWPVLETRLREQIADLFPRARLVPADSEPNNRGADQNLLTALPIQLIPGPPSADLTRQMAEYQDDDLAWSLLAVVWQVVVLATLAFLPLVGNAVRMAQRREEFVAAVSHELRTPLTTFRIYTEMLEEDLLDEQRRKQYIATLAAEAARMTATMENVMAVSRIYRGKRVEPIRETLLLPWLEEVVERLKLRIERSGMTLEYDSSQAQAVGPGATVWIRAQALEQTLANLIDNAAKYAADAADKRIVLSVQLEKKSAILTVRDFGPGFDPAVRSDLASQLGFQSFFSLAGLNPFRFWRRSVEQAARAKPGLGLGIPLSVQLLRSFRAQLRILPSDTGAVLTLNIKREK